MPYPTDDSDSRTAVGDIIDDVSNSPVIIIVVIVVALTILVGGYVIMAIVEGGVPPL